MLKRRNLDYGVIDIANFTDISLEEFRIVFSLKKRYTETTLPEMFSKTGKARLGDKVTPCLKLWIGLATP